MTNLYSEISQMEPMLVSPISEKLEELAIHVVRQSAKLGNMLHPKTKESIIELFREMNSYYSNLIEGNNTSPLEIQKALKNDYAKDPKKRALQLESIAHIEVQKLIDKKLIEEPEIAICDISFICWIHNEFYKRLPKELTVVKDLNIETKNDKKSFRNLENKVIPGELRSQEVQVGHHIAPLSSSLPAFLNRFAKVYDTEKLHGLDKVIAAAASHHRLAWIHPFLDGNGRVVRLFSDAYFKKVEIDGNGLWTMSRGLARNRKRYMEALMLADEKRQGDLDGRGHLSKKGLEHFCKFFLEIALDQINFVSEILEIEPLKKRIELFVNSLVARGILKSEATYLLHAVLLNGEIQRGETARITNMSERSSRNLLKKCLELGLLSSNTPKGPVRLGFPYFVLQYYFPALYI